MQTTVREYKKRPVKPEVMEKLERSRIECLDLTERNLYCPYCGFLIQQLYSDASGHLKAKCPKCKMITLFNLAYFRKMKKRRSYPRFNPDRQYKED